MASDSIFPTLTPDVLDQIAQYLKWDPLISSSPAKLLSQCASNERQTWLNNHRADLERHISWVGTPVFSYALGNAKSYHQIVMDVAAQVGAQASPWMSTPETETILLQKLWNDTLSRLSPEERAELLARVEAAAAQYGISAKKEIVGFAGLAAAQMSGFGVYVLGSTLLGALNSALGLGLGFGAFTGLSSAISIVIGPVGWAALGLYTIKKLGAPNYKKLLPVVILIASQRGGVAAPAQEQLSTPLQPSVASTVMAVPLRETKKVLKPASPSQLRRYSKSEKTTFQLRPENRVLCLMAEEFFPGTHFLDLLDKDQQVIRELKTERDVAEAEEERAAEHRKVADRREATKQRKHEEDAARAAKKQTHKAEAATAKWTRNYSHYWPNLEFATMAIDRLELLAKAGVLPRIEAELGRMNAAPDKVVYRDSISGTDPTVYEIAASYDYRIYFRRNGARTRILLLGDAGEASQDADIALLR